MAVTLPELKQKLIEMYDEVSLLEILQISTDDIVERFDDRIEEKYDDLIEELEEEESDGD